MLTHTLTARNVQQMEFFKRFLCTCDNEEEENLLKGEISLVPDCDGALGTPRLVTKNIGIRILRILNIGIYS